MSLANFSPISRSCGFRGTCPARMIDRLKSAANWVQVSSGASASNSAKPSLPDDTPKRLASAGLRMSPSIRIVLRVRACSIAKLSATVVLPSSGTVEVIATTGVPSSIVEKRTLVTAVRTASANSDDGLPCWIVPSCACSSRLTLGAATSSGTPSFSSTSSVARTTARCCSRLIASKQANSPPTRPANRIRSGLGGFTGTIPGTAGSITRAIGVRKSDVASVSFTRARKVW